MRAIEKDYDSNSADFNNWLKWRKTGIILYELAPNGQIKYNKIEKILGELNLIDGINYLQTDTELRFADPEDAAWFRLSY